MTNILGVLLFCLGLASSLGYILHSPALLHSALATGASPLPTPFRESNGYENFASVRTYTFTFADGTSREVPGTQLTEHLTGPHRRNIVYMQSILYFPVLPEAITMPIARHFFCSTDFLARNGIKHQGSTLESVQIHIKVQTISNTERDWRMHLSCD